MVVMVKNIYLSSARGNNVLSQSALSRVIPHQPIKRLEKQYNFIPKQILAAIDHPSSEKVLCSCRLPVFWKYFRILQAKLWLSPLTWKGLFHWVSLTCLEFSGVFCFSEFLNLVAHWPGGCSLAVMFTQVGSSEQNGKGKKLSTQSSF